MLTSELVRTRVRGDRLELVGFSADARREAARVAAELIEAAHASIGEPREQLEEAFRSVATKHRLEKVRDGLAKLLLDGCVFEDDAAVDAVALRRTLFARAAEARRGAARPAEFDRSSLVAAAAAAADLPVEGFERALFADLRGAHRLLAVPPTAASELVRGYERGSAQAVLLRAERVVVEVRCRTPAAYRTLFRRIKFLRLVCVVDSMPDGRYRLTIDGPASLFGATTKYGLELAMLVPLLGEVDAYELTAVVRWGRSRERLVFTMAGACPGADLGPPTLPEELEALVTTFRARFSDWEVAPSEELVELRAEQVIVPDLTFVHVESGVRVQFELLGHHAREGLFRRVELAGLSPVPLLFAASNRLRVREDIVDEDLPACIYTFKGTLRAGAVHERLEGLRARVSGRSPSPAPSGRKKPMITGD